jgi:chemotaxis protein methyltransferase CheR
MQFVPRTYRDAYFIDRRRGACLRPELLNRIEFSVENILCPSEATTRFLPDIVFCRNVLAYLDTDSRARALGVLRSVLAPNGLMVLDPWTSLPEGAHDLTPVRNSLYKKTESSFLPIG